MTTDVTEPNFNRSSGGVQSLDRAFSILEAMADAGGIIGLSQLAEKADLPLATIHRLVRTLVDLGYVRQEASRQYSLGPRLMRLSDTASKRVGTWTRPAMNAAVARLGESVNLATLDGDEIVYVAQVQPSANFMRMFTEVGRRTSPHATAVGKAILAGFPDDEVVALLERTGMPRYTEHADHPRGVPGRPRGRTTSGYGSTRVSRRSGPVRRGPGARCAPADGDVDVGTAGRVSDEVVEEAAGSSPRRGRDRVGAERDRP